MIIDKAKIRSAPARLYGEMCTRHGKAGRARLGSARQGKARQTEQAGHAVEHTTLDRVILGVIVANTAVLAWGLLDHAHEELIEKFDVLILWFFVAELVIRVKAAGRQCFRDKWLWFDAIVIALALLPLGADATAARILRGARLAHFARHMPHFRHVVHLRWVSLIIRRVRSYH